MKLKTKSRKILVGNELPTNPVMITHILIFTVRACVSRVSL